jgi:RNA recognition motif-containing protein
MSTDSSTSSSSSSSSSDDDRSDSETKTPNKEEEATVDVDAQADATADDCKVFVSRIPQTFNKESVKRVIEANIGDECVTDVSLVHAKAEDDAPGAHEVDDTQEAKEHRGFGFVTFATKEKCQEALQSGTVRGSAKLASKRKHTLYIQPVVRQEENNTSTGAVVGRDICFLWKKSRCPYGDSCKFVHEGEGGCATSNDGSALDQKSKVQKCF